MIKKYLFFICLMGASISFCTISYAQKADSTKMGPPQNIKMQYSSQQVPTQEPENLRFNEFPNCPQTPVCKDINGQLPPNPPANWTEAEYCPGQCNVKRIVNPQFDPDRLATSQPVYSVKNAVCPVGYAQVASWNLENNIIYDPNRDKTVYPLLGPQSKAFLMQTTLESKGYFCSPDMKLVKYLPQICSTTGSDKVGGYSVGDRSLMQHPFEPPGMTYLGQILDLNPFLKPCFKAGSGCKEGKDNENVTPCVNGATENWYSIRYTFISCSPPQNDLYYVPEKVRTTLVCARVKSEWKTVNP